MKSTFKYLNKKSRKKLNKTLESLPFKWEKENGLKPDWVIEVPERSFVIKNKETGKILFSYTSAQGIKNMKTNMVLNPTVSSKEKPCSGCDNTDGKCKASYCPAAFRSPLQTEDYISINCHYASEFLENYPDQEKMVDLVNEIYETNGTTDNIMIHVYKELKNKEIINE